MVYDLTNELEKLEDIALPSNLLLCKEEIQCIADEAIRRIRQGSINMEQYNGVIDTLRDIISTASYWINELEDEADKKGV